MAAKKYIPVPLPCKPHIKKFIVKLYGNPIKADHSTILGCFINLTLEKNIYEHRNLLKGSFLTKSMEDRITLMINRWQFERLGHDISPENVIQINRYFENMFCELLFLHTNIHTAKDGRFKGYKEAIEQFAYDYGIELEYDITYNGLQKMEYRFRNRKKKE